jgi:predicted metal-dependent peptidase
MATNELDWVYAGRRQLLYTEPFYATGLFQIKYEADPNIETFDIDGETLRFNPTFALAASMDKMKSILAHEILHVLLGHHTRRGDRDAEWWNKACDYVVNAILKAAGMFVDKDWLYDPQFANMSAEQIYSKIYQAPSPKPQPPQNQPKPGGGQQQQAGGQQPSQQQGQGQPQQSNQPGKPSTAPGQVRDAPAVKQGTKGAEAAKWKQVAVQAALSAKEAGHMPGGLQRMVDDLVAPKLDWRAILRQFVANTIVTDFSWRRPNKRYAGLGMYLPAPVKEGCGELVIAIDTSGSITQSLLDQFASELRDIQEEVKPSEIFVVYCDSKVNHVDHFAMGDEVELHMHGGGGTDFRPIFEWVEENEVFPKALVLMTDLYGSLPAEAPPYPTLFACTSPEVAPWGETVPFA